jgi:hypothetical protein
MVRLLLVQADAVEAVDALSFRSTTMQDAALTR